jgi:phosphoserine phosphatase
MSIKNPVVINKERLVHYDVDDTLIMWENVWEPGEGKIPVVDPYDGKTLYFRPHKEHIRSLKHHTRAGWFVVIWSAGGWEWANAVAKALEIYTFADMIMSKPIKCYDDMPVGEGISRREYRKDEDKSAKTND